MGSQSSTKKVAIITGASSGIGLHLATHLHTKGWRVAIFGRNPVSGQKAVNALDPTGSHDTAIFIQCDVSSYAAQAAAYRQVWSQWGRLDLVIPNAGAVDATSWYNLSGRSKTVDDVPEEPDTSCTDVHLKGVMYGTLLATHFMRFNQPTAGGKIIATGSIIGLQPCPSFPEYCADKAAIIQWVRATAPLLKSKDNVTINTVLMGAVVTPAMPGFAKAFKTGHLVRPETVLEAYDVFIEDELNEKTGQTVETAHDRLVWHHVPEPTRREEGGGGEATLRTTMVYEPWFAMVHGEKSGLGPDRSLEGPPEGNCEEEGREEEFAVGFV